MHAVKSTHLLNHFVFAALFFPHFQLLTSEQGTHGIKLFFSFSFFYFKNLISSRDISVSLSCKEAAAGEKCQYPSQNTLVTPLTQEKQTFGSVLFSVPPPPLIHLVSKATGSNFFFFYLIFSLLGVWKAQVNGQTWVSIKRDFLISEIMYSMFRI